MITAQTTEQTTRSRYAELEVIRQPYLDRAERYSFVTLRPVMPRNRDNNSSNQDEFQLAFSSTGAENVNHLANSYMLTMFPVNDSFFKLTASKDINFKELGISEADALTLFTSAERQARMLFEQKNGRPALLEMFKHLIVTGNALPYYPEKGNLQVYPLDQYVVVRALDGSVQEIITKDAKNLNTLDSDLKKKVIKSLSLEDSEVSKNRKAVDLYTHIKSDPDDDAYYIVSQSVENEVITEPYQILKTKSRWMPQMWNLYRREHYGRGLVEEHYGTLYSISVLEESLTSGAAALSDQKYLVKPNSMINVQQLNESATGTYHMGNPGDVSLISKGEGNFMQLIANNIERHERILGRVFMNLASQMRTGDRVTATENNLRAQELEKTHGGTYSTIAANLQPILANILLDELEIDLGKNSGVTTTIVSGLDAMGRTTYNDKINKLFEDLRQMGSVAPQLLNNFKQLETIHTLANGRDVSVSGILKTLEDLQAEAQAQGQAQIEQTAQAELFKKATPEQLAEGIAAGQ